MWASWLTNQIQPRVAQLRKPHDCGGSHRLFRSSWQGRRGCDGVARNGRDLRGPRLSVGQQTGTYCRHHLPDPSLLSLGQWLQFDARVSEVEGLLIADYFFFEHAGTGSHNIACDEYHLPAHIQDHIDYITPGIRLRKHPQHKKEKPKPQLRARKIRRETKKPASLSNMHRLPAVSTKYVVQGPIPEIDLGYFPSSNVSNCSYYTTPACLRGTFVHL
jgi:hypothetical protein